MKKVIPAIFVIVSLMLNSCATEKPPVRYDYAGPQNIKLMGGTFNNDNRSYRLWDQLDYKAITVCDSCQVRLQFKDEVTLTATLLSRDNATAKQLSLKGHSENGSFILDKQHKVDFIAFILLWGMGSSHTQLTFTKQNDLLVDNYSEGLGFILFAPGFGASSDHYDQRYARVKD